MRMGKAIDLSTQNRPMDSGAQAETLFPSDEFSQLHFDVTQRTVHHLAWKEAKHDHTMLKAINSIVMQQ